MSSLYLHIPFCEKKCLYCDFYSIEHTPAWTEFLAALTAEITAAANPDEIYETVFFGGGTPSLLEPSHLGQLLSALSRSFQLSGSAEITLEANPGTIGLEKLRAYRTLGVNRLSIGVQSFDEGELRFLDRIHDSRAAVAAVEDARRAGFDNISIDLIFSVPGQTVEQWEKTLRRAIDLGPDHISAYSLIVEEQTPLARLVRSGLVTPNPPESESRLYERTMEILDSEGFEQYEVSNYAKEGKRCRHNVAYWTHENYLGFGPSAHSFQRTADWRSARRWWNIANVWTYAERLLAGRSPVASGETLEGETLVNERIFLGLRSDGLRIASAEKDFRFTFLERQRKMIAELVEREYAVLDGGTLRLTPRGYLLCDEIAERLFL